MKVNYVLFSIILICVYISGCTRLAFELNQERGSEAAINIIIHTHPEYNAKLNIFIDNTRVDMDDLKSLARKKKKSKKTEPAYQMYGTF